jgi:hypothetical protein
VSHIGKESDAIYEEIEQKIKKLDGLANDNINLNIEKDVEEIKIKKILEKERALFNNNNDILNNTSININTVILLKVLMEELL